MFSGFKSAISGSSFEKLLGVIYDPAIARKNEIE